MATTDPHTPRPGPTIERNAARSLEPSINTQNNGARFLHMLTGAAQTDTVVLNMARMTVIPIVFVPGVMGTNLRSKGDKDKAWRVDYALDVLVSQGFKTAGKRQRILHPDRTEVDPNGAVPSHRVAGLTTEAQMRSRGWGEVGAVSYQPFLVWLEQTLNNGDAPLTTVGYTLRKMPDPAAWRPQKPFESLLASENAHTRQGRYPVYAVGYNWLQSNALSAKRLRDRINAIIEHNNWGAAQCSQVIVVTHSMGGLVARACCQLPGMQQKIAGVVHGVMPAIGAAAAYTRCKTGTHNETPSGLRHGTMEDWGGSRVVGKTGKEVTAVFAQAPGPLQLLPNQQYPSDWLQVRDSDGSLLPEQPPTANPYEGIYKERNKWWGLIKEEWLSPPDGIPIDWGTFIANIDTASKFHKHIQDYYHPNTWGFYGQGLGTYEQAVWTLRRDTAPLTAQAPSKTEIMQLKHSQVVEEGESTIGVPTPTVYLPAAADNWAPGLESNYYTLSLPMPDAHKTGTGDGTVSQVSGRAPANAPQVQQFFCLRNIAHEGCYRDNQDARLATVYAIHKIAAPLLAPQPQSQASP